MNLQPRPYLGPPPELFGLPIIVSHAVPPEKIFMIDGSAYLRNMEYIDPGRMFRKIREDLEDHLRTVVRATEKRLGWR
jgi:hypothetical protein